VGEVVVGVGEVVVGVGEMVVRVGEVVVRVGERGGGAGGRGAKKGLMELGLGGSEETGDEEEEVPSHDSSRSSEAERSGDGEGEVWRNRSQHDLEGESCLGIGQMSNHRQLFWRGGVG